MNTKDKLLDFSIKLEKIGKIWVGVEIVKLLLELSEKLTEFNSITNIHELLSVIVLIFSEIMSILLVHLIFKFASLLLEGIACNSNK